MNKTLINKYKAEFNHWLEDGKILGKLKDDNEWFCTANPEHMWEENFGYRISKPREMEFIIIDDDYVKLRKALAEGKTVQYYVDGFTGWQDVTTVGNHCVIGAKNYRIKPEKPQFKIGDYVRYIHSNSDKALQINNINGDRYYFKQTKMSCLLHELELWQPKPNELVILKDKDGIISIINYNGETDVVPFIGEKTWLHKTN